MTADPPSPGAPDELRAALGALEGLEHTPTAAHVAVFERVHAALTDALSTIDEG